MRRGGLALLMAGLPPLCHAGLLIPGWHDWRACLDGMAPPLADAFLYGLRSLGAWPLWPAFLPFLLLAVMWFLRGGRAPVVVWLILMAALVAGHLPPGSTHDCDRKGLSSEIWPLLLALPGFLLSLPALWTTRPRPPDSTPSSPS